MRLGLLLCLRVMPGRNERMIQSKGGTEQGERSDCDLTHSAAQPLCPHPGGGRSVHVLSMCAAGVRGL